MKRLITIILTLTLLISCPAVMPASAGEAADGNAELLFALGCISAETSELLNSGREITRGELASVITQVARLEGEKAYPFSDVDASSPYADAISAVNQYGFMKGDGAGNFRPDAAATEMEALVSFLRLLGYEEYASYKGGYPTGYYDTARSLKLTNGTDGISMSEALSAETLSVLLKNLIDEGVYQIVSVGDQTVEKDVSDRTFLSIYYGIDKVKGVMTGNTRTLLDRASENSGIVVDGRLLQTQSVAFDSYLGMEVEAFYNREESTPVYVYPTNKNKVTEIAAEDILSRDGSRITYEIKENNEKAFTLPADAYIIYNLYAADFSYDVFDIASGSITLIDNDGNGTVDVVSILSYETVIIDSVNSVDMTISLKYNAGTLTEEMLEEADIYDENGVTDLTWFHEWDALDLLRSQTGELVAVYCAGDTISKTIASVSLGGKDSQIVFTDGTSASIRYDALDRFQNLKLQETYLFSTDKYGKLVACTPDNLDKIGALIGYQTAESSLETGIRVRIFTENSEFIIRPLKEKITVDGTIYNIASDTGNAAVEAILKSAAGSLLEYRTDPEGNIDLIRQLDLLFEGTAQLYGNSISCGLADDTSVLFIRMDALAFYIPTDLSTASSENTRVQTVKTLGVPNRYTYAYRRTGGSQPEAEVLKFNYTASSSVGMGEYDQPSLIESKSQVYSEEDESVYWKLTYWYNGNQRSALIPNEEVAAQVDAGDVAYVGLDANGDVQGVINYYDFSEQKLTDDYTPGGPKAKHRRIIGSVYQTFDNLYSLTTADLTGEFDASALMTEYHRFPMQCYVYDTAKGTARKARKSDFIGFAESPDNYAKVFAFSSYTIDYMGVLYK